MPQIEAETTEHDLVEEAEALLTKVAPDGKIRDGASAYLFDMRGPELLRRLVEEVKALRAKVNDPCLVAGYHVCGGKHDLSDLWKG